MRLLSLSLERYGSFTDRLVTFREGAKLHLVYGPNEAGKSSSLAAIGDLLFGISRKTHFAFLHQERDLRLGAGLLARCGLRLDFRRKPGNKGALIGADGESLPDDALAPFLGGLSRDVFGHAFGLNAERLRQDADALLGADGDMGASLLAAASGLRGLLTLRQELEEEADQIYGDRKAQHRLFYQALARYEEASETIRRDELKADDWKALNAEIERLAQALHEIKEQRAGLAREQARLERLKRIAPLFDAIDARLGQIETLGPLPDAAPGFAREIEGGLSAAETLRKRLAELAAEKESATQELASIAIDPGLLTQAEAINGLYARTESYAKSLSDLPRVASERDNFDAQLRQCGLSLGLAEGILLADRQPSAAAMARIAQLAKQGRANAIEQQARRQSLRAEEEKQRTLLREKERLGALSDPAPLQEPLANLGALDAEISKYADLRQRVLAGTQALTEAAARLQPKVPALDELAARALPNAETIRRFQTDLAALETEIRRGEDRRTEALRQVTKAQMELARLAAEGPVPSREAILTARADREAVWEHLRLELLGPGTGEIARRMEQIADFDRLRLEADALADRATGEAQRITDHLRLTQFLREEERKAGETANWLEDMAECRKRLIEEWEGAWTASGLSPLAPAEMQSFIVQLDDLLRRRESLLRERAALDESKARLDWARPRLAALGKSLGLDIESLESGEVQDISSLFGQISRQVQRRKEAFDGARDLAAQERQLAERIADLKTALSGEDQKYSLWAAEWSEAAGAIGLRSEASFEEAEAALDIWRQAPVLFKERDNRARRVDGMQRDQKLFESEAERVLAQAAPDLLALPRDQAIKTLTMRLNAMQKDQSRQEVCRKSVARIESEIMATHYKLEQAEAALIAFAAAIGREPDELPSLRPRLAERERLLKEIEDKKLQIQDLSDGYAERELREELNALDRDRLDADLEALREEGERLVQKTSELYASHEKHLERRQKLEGGDGDSAEIALQQRRNAEAELQAAARDYVVKKIGGKLLERAIARAREERQNPLLRGASAIFAQLTGNDWSAIEQEFGDDDKPHLIGRKGRERVMETVPITGMSEGTRDQLYLALRLAYLADYAERAEAAPFIGDDLFASFDDARTGHGLRALAAIGDRIQPILFTHHAHVVEIARANLGQEVDIINL